MIIGAVRAVIPLSDYLILDEARIGMRLKPEQYCACHFSLIFIEGPQHAILLQKKRLNFLFVLPLH